MIKKFISSKKICGFTLLEVLVSLVLFSIAGIAMAKSFTHHLSTNTRNEQRSAAVMAAQQVLDGLRVLDPATFPSSGSTTQNITVGIRTFSVTTTYCSNITYCPNNNTKHIKVDVKLRGTTIYSVSTVYVQLR